MKTVMQQHNFAVSPAVNIQRSAFNRSHGLKTTFNSGQLIPIFFDEVLPGDTHNLAMSTFGRLATPLVPVMDNMYMDFFFFFVPTRLTWTNWERLQGHKDNPSDSTDFLVPQISVSSQYLNGTLADYMGIPTYKTGFSHSALPFRAISLIYNQWFRDENLQNSVTVSLGDGPDTQASIGDAGLPFIRGKRHDYFTSCLPFPQKGTAVSIPLGTSAPVFGTGKSLGLTDGTSNLGMLWTSGQIYPAIGTGSYNATLGASGGASAGNAKVLGVVQSGVSGLFADLSTASSATINTLRQAFQIQSVYELDARSGTRYVEALKARFGVISPDFRLQRPEYLGGGSVPVNIHPVAQQSASVAGQTPQGNLAAIGTASSDGVGFIKSFTEHGYIIGFVNVRTDLTYQQGLDRSWSRRSRFDFYEPLLAHLGEQAVLNKELFITGTPATDDAAFGYQERWSEYRHKKSMVTGKFRSNDPQSLDHWHLSQDFSGTPLLNGNFIKDIAPFDRITAVPTEPNFMLDCYFRLNSVRPMPTYSVPSMMGRF